MINTSKKDKWLKPFPCLVFFFFFKASIIKKVTKLFQLALKPGCLSGNANSPSPSQRTPSPRRPCSQGPRAPVPRLPPPTAPYGHGTVHSDAKPARLLQILRPGRGARPPAGIKAGKRRGKGDEGKPVMAFEPRKVV